MSVAASVTTNFVLRQWVAPAEAAVRAPTPNIPIAPEAIGWRRGILQGADVGHKVGSVLLLPVDLVAGTLRGSAHVQVQEAHARLQRETGGPLAPLSRKQRFLLRLEDGLLGAAYRGVRYAGAKAGALVGATAGLACGGTLWLLNAAGWGLGRLWQALVAEQDYPRPTASPPNPFNALDGGMTCGQQLGQNLGAFTFGFSIGLATFAIVLASAGVKGLCMAGGALAGGLAGLGEDAKAAYNCSELSSHLEKTRA